MTRMTLSYFLLKNAKSIGILNKYAQEYPLNNELNLVQRYLQRKDRTEYRKKLVDEYKQKLEQEKLEQLSTQLLTIKHDDHHDPVKDVAGAHLDSPSEDQSPPNSIC